MSTFLARVLEARIYTGLLAGKCASSLTHSLGSLRGYTRGHYDSHIQKKFSPVKFLK